MDAVTEPLMLTIEPADRVRQIGDVLRSAELTEEKLSELTDGGYMGGPRRESFALLMARTGDGSPTATVIRLFIAGLAVSRDAAARALSPMKLDDWFEVGILEPSGERVVATVCIEPCHGWLVASDPPTKHSQADVVLAPANASRMLLASTIRRPVTRALDLGCGTGVQALEASRHADEVVAVDINPRAVNMACFNVLANRLDNVDVRLGSFYDPVDGERFGLIVANPPFVISPDTSYTYRDGDLDGDGVVRTLAQQAGAHLEEGGFFQMVCDWATVTGQGWPERLAGWFGGTGCDVLALRSTTMPVEAYAAIWVGQTESGHSVEQTLTMDRWMEAYRGLRIEAVNSGLLVARRRSANRNWFGPGKAPKRMLGPAGDAIARRFELRDRLQAVADDGEFLSLCPRRAEAVRLEQQLVPTEDSWAMNEVFVYLTAGLAEREQIDPLGASLLGRCNGHRSVRQLAEEAAEVTGRPVEELLEQLVPVIESMLELGFLEL